MGNKQEEWTDKEIKILLVVAIIGIVATFVLGMFFIGVSHERNALGQSICDDLYGAERTEFDSYHRFNFVVECKVLEAPKVYDGLTVRRVL